MSQSLAIKGRVKILFDNPSQAWEGLNSFLWGLYPHTPFRLLNAKGDSLEPNTTSSWINKIINDMSWLNEEVNFFLTSHLNPSQAWEGLNSFLWTLCPHTPFWGLLNTKGDSLEPNTTSSWINKTINDMSHFEGAQKFLFWFSAIVILKTRFLMYIQTTPYQPRQNTSQISFEQNVSDHVRGWIEHSLKQGNTLPQHLLQYTKKRHVLSIPQTRNKVIQYHNVLSLPKEILLNTLNMKKPPPLPPPSQYDTFAYTISVQPDRGP